MKQGIWIRLAKLTHEFFEGPVGVEADILQYDTHLRLA